MVNIQEMNIFLKYFITKIYLFIDTNFLNFDDDKNDIHGNTINYYENKNKNMNDDDLCTCILCYSCNSTSVFLNSLTNCKNK